MFLVSVHLPLSSSFGFYSSLQVATSGRVTAQLEFDGWVVLETDPFY
jgi:ribosome assembly protein 1